ncbi:hypothetical protein BH11PSE9_BH11PSE9_05060 [soil metagenome]
MRNALAYANKTDRRKVGAGIDTVFVQETHEAAKTQCCSTAGQFREKLPKLSAVMDDAEHQVLAFRGFCPGALAADLQHQPAGADQAEINH